MSDLRYYDPSYLELPSGETILMFWTRRRSPALMGAVALNFIVAFALILVAWNHPGERAAPLLGALTNLCIAIMFTVQRPRRVETLMLPGHWGKITHGSPACDRWIDAVRSRTIWPRYVLHPVERDREAYEELPGWTAPESTTGHSWGSPK